MKNIAFITIMLLITGFLLISCSEFLEVSPKGVISQNELITPANAEKMVVAAFSALGNDHWVVPYSSGWVYGSVRSDDAYKGGLGTSDQGEFHQYEIFTTIREDQSRGNLIWTKLYEGVGRANQALRILNMLDIEDLPNKDQYIAEARFIRGHFYFLLKIHFKNIPIFDESISEDSLLLISNRQYTNEQSWNLIANDFEFAIDNLPLDVEDVGRPNKLTATAYLAKVRLYQAYEQDESNNVVNINTSRLSEVVSLVNKVIQSNKYGLSTDFAENYLWEFENGRESIFAIQRSINDGSTVGRIDLSTALNYPMYQGYGCCSFHRPSYNLVNAFQTDENGLPRFNEFNNVLMDEPKDFLENTFDPRLDHTVAIQGHLLKYQKDLRPYDFKSDTRGPELYGPFSGMKSVVKLDCPCLTTAKGYPYPASSLNNDVIKYNDLVLWKAEALIELGELEEALDIINLIRERAKRSTKLLLNSNNEFSSNYLIELYKPGVNVVWNQENARIALQWERRLELAMEGMRFFDLVRWGIAAETLNAYFDVEKKRINYLDIAHFTKNRDEYLPIPNQQINLSQGIYKQNYGW